MGFLLGTKPNAKAPKQHKRAYVRKHIEGRTQILKFYILEQAQSKAPTEEIMGPLSQLRQKITAVKYSTKGIKKPKANGRLKAIKFHEMGNIKNIKRVPQQV